MKPLIRFAPIYFLLSLGACSFEPGVDNAAYEDEGPIGPLDVTVLDYEWEDIVDVSGDTDDGMKDLYAVYLFGRETLEATVVGLDGVEIVPVAYPRVQDNAAPVFTEVRELDAGEGAWGLCPPDAICYTAAEAGWYGLMVQPFDAGSTFYDLSIRLQ